MAYDISTVYSHYKRLSAKQRSCLLASLHKQGIPVISIDAYEYTDAPDIKHLFFYFADAPKVATPYFLLEPELWAAIQESIMNAL